MCTWVSLDIPIAPVYGCPLFGKSILNELVCKFHIVEMCPFIIYTYIHIHNIIDAD